MTEDAIPQQPATFVRGNDDLDRLLAVPQIAADVAQAHAEAEEMDRVHAMKLAMIRKAAQLTQIEVARRLGVSQAAVSRMETVATCSCPSCTTTSPPPAPTPPASSSSSTATASNSTSGRFACTRIPQPVDTHDRPQPIT